MGEFFGTWLALGGIALIAYIADRIIMKGDDEK